MKIAIEYESPEESGRAAGQVSSITVWSSSDPGGNEIDFLISGESVSPEHLLGSIDRTISALTATREFLSGVTPEELTEAPHRWSDVPAVAGTRVCACGCSRPVSGHRSDALYATGACRVRVHRR